MNKGFVVVVILFFVLVAANFGYLIWTRQQTTFGPATAALAENGCYPGYFYKHYLSNNHTLRIECDYLGGLRPNATVLSQVAQYLETVTGHDVEFVIDDVINTSSIPPRYVSEAVLGSAIAGRYFDAFKYVNETSTDPYYANKSWCYVIFLDEDLLSNTTLGVAYNAYSYIVFMGTLNTFFGNYTADATRSVMVHEMGHLMGLGHCDNENCVMHESLEVYVKDGRVTDANLPYTFASAHMTEIAEFDPDD